PRCPRGRPCPPREPDRPALPTPVCGRRPSETCRAAILPKLIAARIQCARPSECAPTRLVCQDHGMPDRLSALDASLLYMDEPATPMHVGSVAIFDRPQEGFGYEQLVTLINQRLPLLPRYRQRVLGVPAHLARPVWIDDVDFDVHYHVRRSALPAPGTVEQLFELVARLMARPLVIERPLWEIYLVEGLTYGRFALVTKTHQSMIDGLGT